MPYPITILTPNGLQQNLQTDGLDTLGLTTLALGFRLTDALPTYNANAHTLNVTGATLHAPWRGILQFGSSPMAGVLGATIDEAASVLNVTGATFPAMVGGVGPVLEIVEGVKREQVQLTQMAGANLTVIRAINETSAQKFGKGAQVRLALTAGERTDAFYDINGLPMQGQSGIFRLHPEAVHRLGTLTTRRFGANFVAPIPAVMLVSGMSGFLAPQWYEGDEPLPAGGTTISFHDTRGLLIDPTYVAALLNNLRSFWTGLQAKPIAGASTVQTGSLSAIAGLGPATSVWVHVVDLHGKSFRSAVTGLGMAVKTAPTTALTAPVTLLKANDTLATFGDSATSPRLRWGWATNSTLDTKPLAAPTLTAGTWTGPMFLRLAVVDTQWALLGNRTGAAALGVPPDDQQMPADVLPVVRSQITLTYLTDGLDTLARANAVAAMPNPVNFTSVVCTPALDSTMAVPPCALPAPTMPLAQAHWPAYQTSTGFLPGTTLSPKTGLAATWGAGNGGLDVVVTIKGGQVPQGSHVRLYPRKFVVIPAISTDAPSFLRADGGAAIMGSGDTKILMVNPFGLPVGQAQTLPGTLTVDIVVTPPTGQRRMWAAVAVTVSAVAPGQPAPVPTDSFSDTTPATNTVGAIPVGYLSVAPSGLFGVPQTPPPVLPAGVPNPQPSLPIQVLNLLGSEGSPRQGPRLPAMARFETVVTRAYTPAGQPAKPVQWEAVLTGGRWARETRSALHAQGNPGNPAGPDVHAPGLHVTGSLAYDLTRHALRRALPLIFPTSLNWTGGPSVTGIGWVITLDDAAYTPPVDNDATQTGVGVLLETVAAVCETPELGFLPPPGQGASAQTYVDGILKAMFNAPPGKLKVPANNSGRVLQELRHETFVSKNGAHDALWSLRRAFDDARELIYIESPQFSRTAYPAVAPATQQAWQIDLVAVLAEVLQRADRPNLRVVICTPREPDFASTGYDAWCRQHYAARADAVATLLAAAPDRVAVFHPVGFPGRTAFTRTTTITVDDVYCLSGATHFRRRGMTFDGSAAVASFDRQIVDGASAKVRAYRRQLMAAKLAIPAPPTTYTPGAISGDWMRLGPPVSAFELVRDWLAQGGLGKIQPLWPGPADTTVLPLTADQADPDGVSYNTLTGFATAMVGALGGSPG